MHEKKRATKVNLNEKSKVNTFPELKERIPI